MLAQRERSILSICEITVADGVTEGNTRFERESYTQAQIPDEIGRFAKQFSVRAKNKEHF